MEVYEFNKSFTQRFEELKLVFDSFVYDENEKLSALETHARWVDFAEVTIEPVGWNALWRVSLDMCDELKIRYPTVIYGMVENVFYKELKCSFKILAVDDEDIRLPELFEVPLYQLYPTILQENPEVNSTNTASGTDQIRFFYENLWMPWDCENDDDINCFQKTLQTRLEFYYDIKLNRIEQSLADYIHNQMLDARFIQKRLEYLELDISDAEDNEDVTVLPTKDLIKLHLRMNMVKNEIEILQNPQMRVAYKEINFNRGNSIMPHTHSSGIYLVFREGNLTDKINYLKSASKIVDNIKNVITCATLQEVLHKSDNPEIIYIPPGEHKIAFHERLKNNGTIKTITGEGGEGANAVISAVDDERVLMSFDGDFTLENVTLDCRNVDTGIVIHSGCVVLKNCKLFDNGKSSVKQGIVTIGRATVKLINCVITKFGVGIKINPEANVILMENTIITNCGVGIEMEDGCELGLFDTKISNSKLYGVHYETSRMVVNSQKRQVCEGFDECNLRYVSVNQNFKFENNNKHRNIVVRNKLMSNFVAIDKIQNNDIENKDNEVSRSSIILIDDSFTD